MRLQLTHFKEVIYQETEEEDMFLETVGDWVEYQGFVDLQYRTQSQLNLGLNQLSLTRKKPT